MPAHAVINYDGESREFKRSGGALYVTFVLALVIVFLVLAAQFESFRHPLIIMMTVPLAVAGALLGLWVTDRSINVYSQIGCIMLIGLAAKNGILVPVVYAFVARNTKSPEYISQMIDRLRSGSGQPAPDLDKKAGGLQHPPARVPEHSVRSCVPKALAGGRML